MKIAITLGAFVVLLLLYLFGPGLYTSTVPEGSTAAFERFRKTSFDDVARIKIAKGKGDPVEVRKEAGGWVVTSAYGYPADAERMEKLLKSLKAIAATEELEIAGEYPDSHAEFEVDTRKGSFITLFDKDDRELARLTVGATAQSRDFKVTRVFVRFADEPQTCKVQSDIRSEASLYGEQAESKTFLLKSLFKLGDEDELIEVRLIRPGKDDLLVERRYREVPVEKPQSESESPGSEEEGEDRPEEKPETRKEEYFVVTSGSETQAVDKDKTWAARSLIDRARTLSVEDAAEPKPLGEYGLDEPRLRVIASYRKKEKPESPLKSLSLRFGNATKDDKGEDRDVYFFLEDEEYKGRIYTISKWTFDSWNKELKDFLPEPKEEKPAQSEPPPAAAAEPPAESSEAPAANEAAPEEAEKPEEP
jgi:hypothetical protein